MRTFLLPHSVPEAGTWISDDAGARFGYHLGSPDLAKGLNRDSFPIEVVRGERLVCWSGSLAEGFEQHPLTWAQAGWAMLRDRAEALRELVPDSKICFRTHAAHVLSDAPACRTFLEDFGPLGFEVMLDPVKCLEGQDAEMAEDRVIRMLEHLGGVAGVVAAVISKLQMRDGLVDSGGAADEQLSSIVDELVRGSGIANLMIVSDG